MIFSFTHRIAREIAFPALILFALLFIAAPCIHASSGCPTGTGSCSDTFSGSAGTPLTSYNSNWVEYDGTGNAYTTGSATVEITGTSYARYYYDQSTSDVSQIEVLPTNATNFYTKEACVRISSGSGGYCVGFGPVLNGSYNGCYIEKAGQYLGNGQCLTTSATASHNLALAASGASPVTLTVYVDGVYQGVVSDTSNPFTTPGAGFAVNGDGTAADSDIGAWQDYRQTIAAPQAGCPAGSASCFDMFSGAAGTPLPNYNTNWVIVSGSANAYTAGSDAAEIAGTSYARYYYSASTSDTSQITVGPSGTPDNYSREACVRISSSANGYCVGFNGALNGSYDGCSIEKAGQFIGDGGCGSISASVNHTLALVASGTSPVTLSVYVDGTYAGLVTDSNNPFTARGSGFALEGDGTASDSAVNQWQDYQGTPTNSAATNSATTNSATTTTSATSTNSGAATLSGGSTTSAAGITSGAATTSTSLTNFAATTGFACPTGSGSCYDTFAGSSGAALTDYNPSWTAQYTTAAAFTTGSDAAAIGGSAVAIYYYALSTSDASQITVAASNSSSDYNRMACVRVSSGTSGYCLGFDHVSGGSYIACSIMKGGQFLGSGGCSAVSASASHTLGLAASGTSTVTLSVYLDGILQSSITDSSNPLTVPGSGFGLFGDGTASDTQTSGWQDYLRPIVAATPTFSPGSGTFTSAQAIAISTTTPAANIYYTLDGSTPTTSSTVYTGPVTISGSETLSAIATAPGDVQSAVGSATYTDVQPTVAAPGFSPGSSYVGTATNVSIYDSTSGATILYCQDTSNTCIPTIPYLLPIPVSSTGYIRALAVELGWNSSSIASWSGTYSTLAITTSSCPSGTQYQSYSGCTIAASGGTPPYTFGWSTSSGDALTEGLSINPNTGLVSGTAYGEGVYAVAFTVTDAANATVNNVINIPINGDNSLGGCSFFPSDSIWHLNISGLPVDTSPAAPIPSVYADSTLHLVFGANVDDGGIPFLRVPSDQADAPVTTTQYQSYFTSGPFPAYAPVEGTSNSQGDRHVLVVQTAGNGGSCNLWEMYQGQVSSSGAWTDGSNAMWNLGSYAMLPQDNGSTDAAGLPVAPLLWTYDEVAGGCAEGAECGVVTHPGRLTLNHMLNYHVWPATAQAGVGTCTGGYQDTNRLISQGDPPTSCTGSAPAGEIYRLKASVANPVSCAGHPQAQVLLTAMRNYGLIVADNGMTGGIVATSDARWNDSDLSCLTNLNLSDFEPVNVSSEMINLNSSQVQ